MARPRILPTAITLLGLAGMLQVWGYEYDYGGQFRAPITVFNAFPRLNVTAFVLLEEDRVNRLKYGKLTTLNALLERHSDFIIQFKTVPREEVVGEYTDYGFMEEELDEGMEVVLILQRNTQNPRGGQPTHRVLTSPADNSDPSFSKLYVYNAVWNVHTPDRRLNFYGLYLRDNYDGSQSESISQLAVDMPMNQGREIELEPGTQMEIKAFYSTIGSVTQFKETEAVVHLEGYEALPGRQRFLVAYGDYPSSSTPAAVRILDTYSNSATGLHGLGQASLWFWTVATMLIASTVFTQ